MNNPIENNKNPIKILEMKDIVKTFPGVRALDKASLTLYASEIHALVGENGAGKSTLMKVLQGLYKKDSGSIYYKGELVEFNSPSDALKKGISMIHQELTLIPSMNVAENIWFGRERKFEKFGFLTLRERYEKTKELLRELEIDLDIKAEIETLSVAQMQLVEIARAVSYDSDLIIMDEPTSALSNKEIDHLYKIVKKLSNQGKTIIFISHKLEEIFNICSSITIMRDGKVVKTSSIDELDITETVNLIVGRELKDFFPKTEPVIGEKVFECKNLKRTGVFEDISFYVRKGEILVLWGLMGAGRTEIIRSIFGIDKLDSGEIFVKGKKVEIKLPGDAIKSGLGLVTEDRLRMGAIQGNPIKNNMSVAYLKQISSDLGFLNLKQENNDCMRLVKDLNIKLVNLDQDIDTLSGGNQQKVIIGRWLLTNLDVLILDEPTRGIDVGAKAEVYRLIDELAHRGLGVIMVSSELPETLGMADRIIVISNGSIAAELPRSEVTQNKIMGKVLIKTN